MRRLKFPPCTAHDGRTDGLVVDSGAGVSYTVPIVEGFVLHHQLDLAGHDIDNFLESTIIAKGNSLSLTPTLRG